MRLGELDDAKRLLETALMLMQAAPPYHAPQPGRGTPILKSLALAVLAGIALRQERHAEAHGYGERSLHLCNQAHDVFGGARVAYILGITIARRAFTSRREPIKNARCIWWTSWASACCAASF